LYLDDVHIELLDKLAQKSGRTKQDLLREAVNTLLVEYQMFKLHRRKTGRKPDSDRPPSD
jgi:predicted DNA-binding protein